MLARRHIDRQEARELQEWHITAAMGINIKSGILTTSYARRYCREKSSAVFSGLARTWK
jgi:hypothetical protein